jgi:UPF0755 protein
MTIRSGRGPRDEAQQARPMEPGSYDGYDTPRPGRDVRRSGNGAHGGTYGGRRGGGLPGFLKFLIFALVLGFIVLTTLLTVLRPLVASAVVDWAYDNPGALRIPFVTDLVRDNLGDALSTPASADATEVEFEIRDGDSVNSLADRLEAEGLITNRRAFVFQATVRELAPKLQAGDYHVARNLTPDQVVTALTENRIVIVITPITFREGLRLEQITAKLQLDQPASVDAQEFYDLATEPPADLLADFPWIEDTGRPEGASLEGFLAPATYDLVNENDAEDLIRMMLTEFEEQVGTERMTVPEERGLTFYEVLTLASIVEREAVLDEERPIIAGTYQNHLSSEASSVRLLAADPTVFYALDTIALREREFDTWREFPFWVPPGVGLSGVELPEDLAGYQTYQVPGLPPGPICTPSEASIAAALEPDQSDGFLYFVAIPDGGGAHDFSKTFEEHQQKLVEYGYR